MLIVIPMKSACLGSSDMLQVYQLQHLCESPVANLGQDPGELHLLMYEAIAKRGVQRQCQSASKRLHWLKMLRNMAATASLTACKYSSCHGGASTYFSAREKAILASHLQHNCSQTDCVAGCAKPACLFCMSFRHLDAAQLQS